MARMTKSGPFLTGAERITIYVKDWYKSWRKYFRSSEELAKIHGDEFRRSWVGTGKRLQRFEREHGIRFGVDKEKDEVVYFVGG